MSKKKNNAIGVVAGWLVGKVLSNPEAVFDWFLDRAKKKALKTKSNKDDLRVIKIRAAKDKIMEVLDLVL